MKVLHTIAMVDDKMSMGGPLVGTQKQILATRELGIDAEMASVTVGPAEEIRDHLRNQEIEAHLFPALRVASSGVSAVFSLSFLRWLWAHARRYSVVHVHAGRDITSILTMAVCKLRRVPYVAQTHGMIVKPGRFVLKKFVVDRLVVVPLLRRARLVFALQQTEIGQLVDLGLLREQVVQVRNGVLIPAHRSLQAKEVPVVCMVNRMNYRKRPLVFIDAAERVAKTGLEVRFVMAGPDDGALDEVLQKLESIDEAKIEYVGALSHDEATRLIENSDLFVLTSMDEPFPNALMEALAAGTPTIVTESVQLRSELEEFGASLVTGHDAPSIAAAIREMLTGDARRLQYGAAGRLYAERRLSMGAVAKSLRENYEAAGR